MDKQGNNGIFENIALLIALANAAFFGLMFVLMHYFELVGADTSYFDQGTFNNLEIINKITGLIGVNIDPSADPTISTLGYGLCLGLALVSTFVAFVIAARQPRDNYEVTDAKK